MSLSLYQSCCDESTYMQSSLYCAPAFQIYKIGLKNAMFSLTLLLYTLYKLYHQEHIKHVLKQVVLVSSFSLDGI